MYFINYLKALLKLVLGLRYSRVALVQKKKQQHN